jgi:undecaprenyl diphosphate synthase
MTVPGSCPLPGHVGIIMDGNGRWAKARGRLRSEGHRQGLEVAKSIVLAARELGIQVLSLYVFSTENWKRAEEEVGFLMGLIRRHLRSELAFYREIGARIVHSGDAAGLPAEVLAEVRMAEAETAGFDGIVLNLAINYGGRDEIVRAFGRAAARYGGSLPVIDEETLGACMDRPELPAPDLIIRTGGEYRLSNFLLWEAAYAELLFSDKLWPDFTRADFSAALEDYGCRDRRFGGTE